MKTFPHFSRRDVRPGQAASSITEVLVAVMVLATMVIALYAGFSSGFSVAQQTRENLRATQIMMQKVEAVRLCTWDQFTNLLFVERYDPFGVSSNAGGAVYRGTVTFGPAGSIPDTAAYKTNLRLVTVTIQWTNFSGVKHIVRSRQMETHVARYGMQNYSYGMP